MMINRKDARNIGPICLSTACDGAIIKPCKPILSSIFNPALWVGSRSVGFWSSGKDEARSVSVPNVKSMKCELYIPPVSRSDDHILSTCTTSTGERRLIACHIPLNAVLIIGVFSGLNA